MSHPDPLHNEENTMDFDINYDDYNDFHDGVDADDRTNDYWAGDLDMDDDNGEDEDWDDTHDDSMDGDHESGLASAGWGTDEDYGYYGDYNEDY